MPAVNFLILSTTLLPFLIPAVQASVVLPYTSGLYNVTTATIPMVDHKRLDPFAPNSQPRAVMVSVFQPVAPSECTHPSLVEYMPPTTAAYINTEYNTAFGLPNGLFSQLQIAQCPFPTPKLRNKRTSPQLPIILFSPALATSRLFYNFLATTIASQGYTVLTIDHPHDTDIVTFPDGTIILANATSSTTEAQLELNLETRALDASFILDQLSIPSVAKQLVPNIPCGKGFDVHNVGMFGHSLGGAAVATTMLRDKRIAAGVNLDGTFFGPVVSKGLDRPFMLFGHTGKNATTDPSWAGILPNLRGFKLELGLADSEHYSFSDLGTLVEILGLTAEVSEDVWGRIGRIEGQRAVNVIAAYVAAFFDKFLKGAKGGLLDRPSKAFPEVSFVVQ